MLLLLAVRAARRRSRLATTRPRVSELGGTDSCSWREGRAAAQAARSRQALHLFLWRPGDYVLTAASADQSVWGDTASLQKQGVQRRQPRTDITLSYDRVRLVRSCDASLGI